MAFTGEIFDTITDGIININKHRIKVPKLSAMIYPILI